MSLRVAGALHAAALTGRDKALAAEYPEQRLVWSMDRVWPVARAFLEREEGWVREVAGVLPDAVAELVDSRDKHLPPHPPIFSPPRRDAATPSLADGTGRRCTGPPSTATPVCAPPFSRTAPRKYTGISIIMGHSYVGPPAHTHTRTHTHTQRERERQTNTQTHTIRLSRK